MQKKIGISIGIMLLLLFAFGVFIVPQSTVQAASSISLGSASTFAVLAASTITNTGPTTLTGDLGLYAGTSFTGSASVTFLSGSAHITDALAQSAQTALTTAIGQASSQSPTGSIVADLAGQTLVGGVYNTASSIGLSGVLTLNGQGNPNSVWVFQAGSSLTTGSADGSSVVLENSAQACNVFWQVGSSATIGTSTSFVGTILASDSITLDTGATIQGAALASTGAVTMDSNTVAVTPCAVTTTTTTTTISTTPTTTRCNSGLYSGQYTNTTTHQIVHFYDLAWSIAYPLAINNGPSGIYEDCSPPPITTTTTTTATTTALPSCVYLTVNSQLSNGTLLTGEYSDIWANNSQSVTGCVPPNTVEVVGVFDSSCHMFSHWLDTGSALRFRPFSISSNTTFTAIYTNSCVSTPSTSSIISVNTVNSSNAPITGLYITLWQNGTLLQSCFSPCSFTVKNGYTYQVAVADFGTYALSHWTDSTTNRFHTVIIGNSTTTVSLVAVYNP